MTTLHCLEETPTATPRRDAPARRANRFRCDRRGSAIILVVVSIVLMAILGATFVQITRFERIDTGGEHIDIAINSVLNEVAVVLAQDLYDDNGNFFNHTGSAGTDGGGDEPFDYPWTDSTVAQRPVVFVNGNPGTAEGGVYDDPWLADLSAKPNGAIDEWPHLSDLTGRFLNVGTNDLTTLGQANPGEVASTAAMVTDINTLANQLVDADGDGIGDSLWAYCPAAEIAGKRYVYAIRIVDLSAKININTALGITDTAGNPNAGIPRGDSPTDIDATGYAHAIGGTAGSGTTAATAVNEFYQTVVQRFGGTATVPVAWGDATDQRRHYWLNGASLVNNALVNQATDASYDPNDRYGQSDLLELLYKNGLNNPAVATPLEDDMPTLLRRDNFEIIYNDPNVPAAYKTNGPEDWTQLNPRVLFTTESGAMVIAPPVGTATTLIGPDHDSDGTGERILRADINHSSLADLTEVIQDTILANGTFDATNFGHFGGSAAEFAAQLAANIVDLRDPDNQLTTHNGQTGMEALPFVSEVYVQRFYNAVASAETPVGSGVWTHQYTAGARTAQYMIELRNPFRKPVSLENVFLYVDGVAFGGTGGELSTFPGVPADNLLQPGAAMFIYFNGRGEDMLNGYTPVGDDIDSPITDAWPIGTTPVQVELRGEDQGTGTTLAWPYCGVVVEAVENIPNGWETTNSMVAAPLPGGANNAFYIQHSYHGADGVNLLQCEPSDFGALTDEPESYDGTMIEAGSTSKTREPTVAGGQFVGDWNGGDMQWLFLDKQTSATDNDGRIPYVADVLTIPVIGPNDPGTANTTLATAIQTAGVARLDNLMLDYRASTTPVISNISPSLNVPHAVLLLERLTTHSPAVDGFDLDGDGVDVTAGGTPDYDEVYVPGKINLNTASVNVLATTLPFPTQAQRTAVANRIIAFREATARPATARDATQPGIAYTGELYELLTADLAGLNPQPDWNDHQVGGMTSGNTFLADNITGDREEDLMLAKWLNEVCSTRSDVFAVYLVVQGFPEGNFGAGAVESARVVAVFSRANVRQAGDKAQLIAVRRIE
jgi:hypothetical protein